MEAEQTEMSEQIFIKKWCRFLLVDGKWTVELWPNYEPMNGKIYRLNIPVPAELVGTEIKIEVTEETQNGR
jgi:hypothetical protein